MAGGLTDAQFDKDPRASYRSRNWLRSPWNILTFTSEYRFSEKSTLTFKSALNTSARDLVWKNEDGGPAEADSISPITNSYVMREVQRESFLSSTNELRFNTRYNIAGVSQTLAVGVRYFQGSMQRSGGGPGSVGSDFDLKLYGAPYAYDLNFATTNVEPLSVNPSELGIIPLPRYTGVYVPRDVF